MKRLHRTGAFTLVELLVVIGIIALLISILLPSLNRVRETANRVKCAANLKSIGLSMIQYAADNRGSFPRTRSTGGLTGTFKVTWGSGTYQAVPAPADPINGASAIRPADNDVTAALFRLLTTMDITGQSFVCPSSNAEAWDYGGGINTQQNWVNWNGPSKPSMTSSGQGTYKNLSYSVQCAYADDNSTFKWSPNLGSDFAIAADMNPGTPTDKGSATSAGWGVGSAAADDVLFAKPNGNQKIGNSSNHQKDGQNVLYADGHVDFTQSCFAGPNGDNIYARKKTSQTVNKESDGDEPCGSTDQQDSVLLPMD